MKHGRKDTHILGRMASACLLLLCSCASCYGQHATNSAEITLCDLYQRPELYAGKTIKVRGGSVSSLALENLLHDSQPVTCSAYMRIVVVLPDEVKPVPDFQLIRDDSYRKLQEALHGPGPIRIDATYEGRFDAAFTWRNGKRVRVGQYDGEGFGNKRQYDGWIVLQRVSDVWSYPLPHRFGR